VKSEAMTTFLPHIVNPDQFLIEVNAWLDRKAFSIRIKTKTIQKIFVVLWNQNQLFSTHL